MRFWLACSGVAVVCAALVFSAPASAKPAEFKDNSIATELERFAATLKAQSARALDAAADTVQDGKGIVADAKTRAATQFEKFRDALNEQKATLAIIGEDAATRLNAWKQETVVPWLDSWPGAFTAWAETLSEDMHRSATEALTWFRGWLNEQFAPEEPTEIPV